MKSPVRSLWAVLDKTARRNFIFLAIFSTVAGAVETASVGLIIPFMAAATDTGPFGKSREWTDGIKDFVISLGVPPSQVTVALALLFVLGNLGANATLVAFQYYALRIVFLEKASLSTRLMRVLVNQPLDWYENENSGDLSKSAMAEVDRVVSSLSSLSQLIGICFRSLLLAFFFLIVQFRLAVTLSVTLGFSFYCVFRYIHRPLTAAGEQSLESLSKMYKISTEIFTAVREIKVTKSAPFFIARFSAAADNGVEPEVVRGMPPHVTRMVLESAILGLIMAVFVYFNKRDGNLANGLPIMSAYAIAGIRLLPTLQQGLFYWVQIRFLTPSVYRVEDLLQLKDRSNEVTHRKIVFDKEIRMTNVNFAYAGASATLSDINLKISKNERVAFVGSTGAGKSTLMELLLGLRTPSSGNLLVDAEVLRKENQQSWLSKIGYVPQEVYLLDATVLENIAFGVSMSEIDLRKVEQAARYANIHDFITNELPLGYHTEVGERGARLSGGQCQRLSIARAMYHDPEVVVFDEATSALDHATEEAILTALEQLKGKKTLIVVAHRLNTVWDFDRLFVLDKGRCIAEGKATELMETNQLFRSLVKQPASRVEYEPGLEREGQAKIFSGGEEIR